MQQQTVKEIRLPSREMIAKAMKEGTTTWWEKDGVKDWEFHFVLQEDVFNRIFFSKNKVAAIQVFDRPLMASQIQKLKLVFRQAVGKGEVQDMREWLRL